MKYTFTPTKQLLQLPLAFRKRWARALMKSRQTKEKMSNSNNTAHCCLCVLERLDGATFEDYRECGLPSEMRTKSCVRVGGTRVEKIPVAFNSVTRRVEMFATLNDDYLTHKQIAQLLLGKTVEVNL